VSPSIIGVGASMKLFLQNLWYVSTLNRLFCVCGSCWGTYSPPQTLLLDLSGPLGGEGKATWRGRRKEEGKKGKVRDRKRSGLN